MYEAHFGLREKPFSLLPDPSFLYFSQKHSTAFAMLEYGLANQAGFTVITGGIGTGKTTLLRHLLNNIEQTTTVGMITNTHRAFGELLQWILVAFNIEHTSQDSKADMYQAFVDFVINEYAHNRRTVLIVDEAQNMDAETLEELRMLSNINADKDQVLQIILVGQDELRDTLRSPRLVQFCQRIVVDYQLTPLTLEDTCELIGHRISVAGGDPAIFPEDARTVVHRYSGGIPRLVNLLCDMSMVYAFAEQSEAVSASLVEDVAREKQSGGLFPVIETASASLSDNTTPARIAKPQNHTTGSQVQTTPAPEEESSQKDDHDNDINLTLPVAGALSRTEQDEADASGETEITPDPELIQKRPLRIAIAGESPVLRRHLRKLVEPYNIEVIAEIPLSIDPNEAIDPFSLDILLVDMDEEADDDCADGLCDLITEWNLPVLFNDSELTQNSLAGKNPKFPYQLVSKLISLLPPETNQALLDLPSIEQSK